MNVFTYGSLMFPEVWQRVTGRSAVGEPASLSGFEARCLRDVSYPMLIPVPGAETPGILYRSVDPDALERLDLFEGEEYRRIRVTVAPRALCAVPAEVYTSARTDDSAILPVVWDPIIFARIHLARFLQDYGGFAD